MVLDILVVLQREESYSCVTSAHINPRDSLWPGTGHMPITGLITLAKEMEYLLHRPREMYCPPGYKY